MATDVQFTPTTWIAGSAPGISAAQLNRIELGVDTLAAQFSSHNGGTGSTDHPIASAGQHGFMSNTNWTKLNGIATGATTDQTAAEILAALLTVDGPGSGLNADNFDNLNSSQFARSDATDDVIRLRFGNGSAAAPAISFTNGTDTGFSYNTSGFIYLSFNGTSGMRMTDDGSIQLPQSATAGYEFDGTVKIRSNNNVLQIDSASQTRFRIGTTELDCAVTNRLALGSTNVLFSEVWASDGSINTSDASVKESMVDLDLGLAFVRALRKVSWVWAGRTRPHAGFSAQNVRTVLTDLGIDDFAGYIDPTVAGYTPSSPEDTDPPPTGWDNLALRPTEFIAPAYVAISELATRLEALEATLAEDTE